jgi:hypothetical protein
MTRDEMIALRRGDMVATSDTDISGVVAWNAAGFVVIEWADGFLGYWDHGGDGSEVAGYGSATVTPQPCPVCAGRGYMWYTLTRDGCNNCVGTGLIRPTV